jgi:hypothetical protein
MVGTIAAGAVGVVAIPTAAGLSWRRARQRSVRQVGLIDQWIRLPACQETLRAGIPERQTPSSDRQTTAAGDQVHRTHPKRLTALSPLGVSGGKWHTAFPLVRPMWWARQGLNL